MAEDVRTEVFEKIYPENAERKTEIADNIGVYGGHTQQELNRPPLHQSLSEPVDISKKIQELRKTQQGWVQPTPEQAALARKLKARDSRRNR